MTKEEIFVNVLIAAMKDAVDGDHITQLKSTIEDKRGKVQHVRIVVMPEKMTVEYPQGFGN